MSLRDILNNATPGRTDTGLDDFLEANEYLEEHARELAALCLDMGDLLRAATSCCYSSDAEALLARLDQLGAK